ncbi:MAG: DNA alkylation repair protein [Anaerolineales bacterium]|nr:DNA alkylation repair protein [Anaerolineales bacterium]
MSKQVLQKLRLSLEKTQEDETKLRGSKALHTSVLRNIARYGFQEIKTLPKDQVFALCEQLLASGDGPERLIAFQWAFRIRKQFDPEDFGRFERWLSEFVTGWGSCDDFCTHAFGYFIYAYPQFIPNLTRWTRSTNRWFRRGGAVVLIYAIRRGKNFQAAFEIADRLLTDPDDLVQKGYGWMLKEISNLEPEAVYNFVLERKDRMPRTALRYAIEKLDPQSRAAAMAK